MIENNYTYVARLQLDHSNLALHPLRKSDTGKAAMLESEGFSSYKPCAEALNILAHDLIDQLIESTKKEFIIAWETNPKDGKATHLHPVDQWSSGEVIKFYVIEKTETPVTLQNLNPMLAASIMVSTTERSMYN